MLNRFLPIIIFVVASAIGLAMTYAVYLSSRSAELARFEVVVDDAVDRIQDRVSQHIALLIATQAHLKASGFETRKEFSTFVGSLALDEKYEGVRGIGFAKIIKTGEEEGAAALLAQNYGPGFDIRPATTQSIRTPIVLLEPDDVRNRAALGYDMYSEANRRSAMDTALQKGQVSASAPVELVQEITSDKQSGFLVYLPPLNTDGSVIKNPENVTANSGFVYAAFRAGDLHEAAIQRNPPLPLYLETTDVSGNPSLLFRSVGLDLASETAEFRATRQINIADRNWNISFYNSDAFTDRTSYFPVFMLGGLSLMFAAALAVSTRSQLKSLEAAQELQKISMAAADEKDMLMQEMKHRIKNSIARIMAMSRQTASASENLQEYSKSFSARLQSMANAQDLLTSSKTRQADLRDLLGKELEQVFGHDYENAVLSGPTIKLDEKATQALGLVFHELATNALKYANIDNSSGALAVNWKLVGHGTKSHLEIDWVEQSETRTVAPQTSGFGSRLIDANINGELNGIIERSFDQTGLRIHIGFPFGSRIADDKTSIRQG